MAANVPIPPGIATPPPPTTVPKTPVKPGKEPLQHNAPTANPITISGTSTSWHEVVLWFLGAVALIALADPAPQIATGIVVLLILGALLNNWDVYKSYLGLK